MSSLARANLLLLALLIAHTLDHGLSQPDRVQPGSAELVGIAGFVLVAASSVLALRRSPVAARAAVAVGGTTLLGLVAIHLLPAWSGYVSDPYWDFDADWLSWLSLAALVGGAVWLALTGLRTPGNGVASPTPAPSAGRSA